MAIAFSAFATVARSTVPTFKNVTHAVVPPPVKLSVASVPALEVTENDLTSQTVFDQNTPPVVERDAITYRQGTCC